MENVLIVPGLRGSGPAHWQSWLHAQVPGSRRVEQQDNAVADLKIWSQRVASALEVSSQPAWIVAHSFGTLATLHALEKIPERVEGILLVAPADPDKFGVDHLLPQRPIDIPAILVGSRNDPWLTLTKARGLARRIGASFLDLGEAGHINTESGYGPWPRGLELLRKLQAVVAA